MKLLLFYISHTFINSIKKIFRTWVAIFIGCIILFGVLFGAGTVFFVNHVVGDEEQIEEVNETEETDEELGDEKLLKEIFDELSLTERKFYSRVVTDVVWGICLMGLLFFVYGARKGGSEIFTMADVNFLFTAPMKPQSVLLFKTILQMGMVLLATLYFGFQIPNMVLNIGLSVGHVVLIFVVYVAVMIFGKLLSILVYTVTATNTSLRKYIHPFVYGVIILVSAVVVFGMNFIYEDFFSALYEIFSGRFAMAIPIVGWIAGLVYSCLMREYMAAVIFVLLLVAGGISIVFLIWKLKADFYEDALTSANNIQEKVEAVKTGIKTNEKHSKRIKREGEIGKGEGASAFFYKHMYTRKRFAGFGVITNTMVIYGAIALIFGIINQIEEVNISIHVVGGILLTATFFKSYASPMVAERMQNFIYLVPEQAHKKIFNLMGAEMLGWLLDLIPTMVLMILLFDASILKVILWILVIISFAFILVAVALFIDMIIPESLPNEVKSLFVIFGEFGGVLPMGIVVGVLVAVDLLSLAFVLSFFSNVLVGCVLTGISAALLHVGGK